MRGVGGVVWEVAVQNVGQNHRRGTVALKQEMVRNSRCNWEKIATYRL